MYDWLAHGPVFILFYQQNFIGKFAFFMSYCINFCYFSFVKQFWSCSRKSVFVTSVWLLFLQSTDAIFIIPFPITFGLMWLKLLVLQWSMRIWVLFGNSILPACHTVCCTWSLPMQRLNFFRKSFSIQWGVFLDLMQWSLQLKFSCIYFSD